MLSITSSIDFYSNFDLDIGQIVTNTSIYFVAIIIEDIFDLKIKWEIYQLLVETVFKLQGQLSEEKVVGL